VLDIRLPEDFQPDDSAQLLKGLLGLWPQVMPYLLSFFALGLRWLGSVQVRSRAEFLSGPYIGWWLVYLLLITCVPFTASVVGRYASLAPAIWLYAGNGALIAIVTLRLMALVPEVEDERQLRTLRYSTQLFLGSTMLCIGWSFIDPSHALWVLLLNLAGPEFVRWNGRSSGPRNHPD